MATVLRTSLFEVWILESQKTDDLEMSLCLLALRPFLGFSPTSFSESGEGLHASFFEVVKATTASFIEAVTKTLKAGGKVTLVGFGTFLISKRKARKGRNPQTGEEITIKARKVARFKAGKELAAKL